MERLPGLNFKKMKYNSTSGKVLFHMSAFFKHFMMKAWKGCSYHSSGSVQDFHLIPFSSPIKNFVGDTNAGTKVIFVFRMNKENMNCGLRVAGKLVDAINHTAHTNRLWD